MKLGWMVVMVPALAAGAPAAPPKATADALAARPSPGSMKTVKPSAFTAKAKLARQRATDTSSLTPSAVGKKVETSYVAGVEACYQTRLDAGLRTGGNVEVALVVTSSGATSQVAVKSFDKALTTCVMSKAATWSFAAPTRQGVPATSGFELLFALEARDAAAERKLEEARMAAEAQRIADALGATDPNDKGLGDTSYRRPGADLGSQIAGVKDPSPRTGTGAPGTGRASSGGRGSTITAPGTTSLAGIDGPATKHAKSTRGRVSFGGKKALADTTLTVDAVASKVVTAYMAGIKRCYATRLAVAPTAKGTLKLRFSVSVTGRASAPVATPTRIDASVATCVAKQAESWRFAVPKDAHAAPTTATFELDLTLVPD